MQPVQVPRTTRDGPICHGLHILYSLAVLLVLGVVFQRLLNKPTKAVSGSSSVAIAGVDSGHERLTKEGVVLLHDLLDSMELPDIPLPGPSNFRTELKEFYGAFDDTLPWILEFRPTSQARSIIPMLESAETKGLRREDYGGPQWDVRLSGLEQSKPAPEAVLVRFDVELTVSAMRYVSDLHFGRINPRLYHFGLDIDRQEFDLSEFLRRELVDAQDVHAVMETVEPPFPAYHETRTALNRYMQLAREDNGEQLPAPAKAIKQGNSYAGVPRLTRLLHLLGDLPAEDQSATSSAIYDGGLLKGVKHFQQRHGLDPTGLIDASTVKQLNVPLARRVEQLKLTLERWRWLPHQFKRPPIVIDIPAFRVYAASEDYQVDLSMNVIVGRAYQHKTPVFASQLKSVIFRPYWNVPLQIQRKELVPQIERNPSYLMENSYEIVDSRGEIVSDGEVNDEMLEKLRSGKLAIRQRPGPENALGLIKFEFPNPYDVYMHDTPAKHLFARSRRDFSHGCIRVEDAVALATWVLRDDPEWTPENIRAAMNGEETLRVEVKNPIPVLILYGTAVVLENGVVQFYEDIYGYDAELERALAKPELSSN